MFKAFLLISKRYIVAITLVLYGAALCLTTHSFAKDLSLVTVVEGMSASWALKVSPDNELYVTHRNGELSRYTLDGRLVSSYSLGLEDLYYKGQGGLLAIAFHPDYETNQWIYASYSFGSDSANGLKVIRFRLSDKEGSDPSSSAKETIFEQVDLRDTAVHYGARLLFLQDKSLLISTGDGFDYREQAQVLESQLGKILRVTDTGAILENNPYSNAESSSQQYVYSVGHRNPQGLVLTPSGTIVAHEHGPDGGDELNIITPSNNYGWPIITKGKDYIGSLITPFTEYQGMQQPGYNWTPSIAPSGMIYYTGTSIKELSNKLLITSLKYKQMHAISLTQNDFDNEVVYFENSDYRMRDIAASADERIFILTDGEPASILEIK